MLEELGQEIVLSSLNHEKILRALMVPGRKAFDEAEPALSAQLLSKISRCESQVLRFASPKAVLRILPVEQISPILIGDDIRRLLSGCSEAALMALTLGASLEKCLMREEVTNMQNAYIMDVCASQAVEDASDAFGARLGRKLRSAGRYLTNRYSPGYGDYPLSVQKTLLEYLNAARTIGLTLTPTDLMVPRKSITAVMGISDQPKPDVYGTCTHCPLITKCFFRELGERCFHTSGMTPLQGSADSFCPAADDAEERNIL